MKYLYCLKKAQFSGDADKNPVSESVKVFTPKIGKLLLCGEQKNVKTSLVRLLFQLSNRKRYRLHKQTRSFTFIVYIYCTNL